jgi:hypothetical protein
VLNLVSNDSPTLIVLSNNKIADVFNWFFCGQAGKQPDSSPQYRKG